MENTSPSEINLEHVYEEVKKLDPKLSDQSDTFKAAVILLSALVVGNRTQSLIGFTHYDRHFIRNVAKNLRKNGIWRRQGIFANWEEDGIGYIAFWLDVMIGLGQVEKPDEKN